MVGSFLDPRKQLANVIGMGIGVKWTKGEPTGKPVLVVLVTQKLAKNELSPSNMVPNKLQEMQTDVLAIGYSLAGQAKASIQTLGKRVHPAEGGYKRGT